MKKNNRIYSTTDAYMLQTANTLQVLFRENLTDFTALDSTLNTNYADQWLTKINEAYTLERHSQLKDVLREKTEVLLQEMANCRTKYKEVKFFAAKAFNNQAQYLEAFGTKQFGAARLKPNYMIAFMDEMDKACTKYQTELLAAGMSQSSIEELATLRDSLFDAHTAQETLARTHAIKTQERIAVLNECYLMMRDVIKAAMIIYEHDFARRKMFVFKPSKQNNFDQAA